MDDIKLNKIVNFIFDNIILVFSHKSNNNGHEEVNNNDIENEQIVKLLLSLEDGKGSKLLNYKFASGNSIILDDNSRALLVAIINKILERKYSLGVVERLKGIEEDILDAEESIKDCSIDDKQFWNDTITDLINEKKDLEKLLAIIDNVLMFLSKIKDKEIKLPQNKETPLALFCNYSVLKKDLKKFGSNIYGAISNDLDEMAKQLNESYDSNREAFDIFKISSPEGSGIHSFKNKEVMYKDLTNNLRIIIVPDNNNVGRFYIRGIVLGHGDDANRDLRFKNANQGIGIGNESEEDFRRFSSELKNHYLKTITNPIIEYLDVITMRILEDVNKKEANK